MLENEDTVVKSKFAQKLAQKGISKQDIEVPVSRKDLQAFIRFYVKESPSGKSASVIGISSDRSEENTVTSTLEVSNALCRAYNAVGFSDQHIEKIDPKDFFKS